MKRALVALIMIVAVIASASVAMAENGTIKPWSMTPTGGRLTR